MANSLREMRPSVFRPTSTMAKSFSMATMVPLMTWPSWGDWVSKLCSSMAAKSSREGAAMEDSVRALITVAVAARAMWVLYVCMPMLLRADALRTTDFPGPLQKIEEAAQAMGVG